MKRSCLENIHLCHPPPLSAVGDSACGSCFLIHPAHFTQTHLLIVRTSSDNTNTLTLTLIMNLFQETEEKKTKQNTIWLKQTLIQAPGIYPQRHKHTLSHTPINPTRPTCFPTGESLVAAGHSGPLKTPLTRRKCPLLRCVELMTR